MVFVCCCRAHVDVVCDQIPNSGWKGTGCKSIGSDETCSQPQPQVKLCCNDPLVSRPKPSTLAVGLSNSRHFCYSRQGPSLQTGAPHPPRTECMTFPSESFCGERSESRWSGRVHLSECFPVPVVSYPRTLKGSGR